jgi:hypothetical protein
MGVAFVATLLAVLLAASYSSSWIFMQRRNM